MSTTTGNWQQTKSGEPSINNERRYWFFLNHIKYEHLIAGISGGVASTLACHPLDVVRIRLAVADGQHLINVPQYNGIANAFRTIYQQEGLRGFYRGVVPNVWGAGASWGLYFFFYNAIKKQISSNNNNATLNAGNHLLAASEAGLITLMFTNPIWVVKTRLCLQYGQSDRYRGMWDALIKIYRQEGIRGWYKGLVPGMFGVSHGAVQFMVYEQLKTDYNNWRQRNYGSEYVSGGKLETWEYLTFAATSKVVAAGVTYPYQVVKARLQNQHYQYKGTDRKSVV